MSTHYHEVLGWVRYDHPAAEIDRRQISEYKVAKKDTVVGRAVDLLMLSEKFKFDEQGNMVFYGADGTRELDSFEAFKVGVDAVHVVSGAPRSSISDKLGKQVIRVFWREMSETTVDWLD